MRAFDELSGRWLFCFAHPDDELAVCAWVSRLIARGQDVFMAWAHSTPLRELEARRTANQLGVRASNLRFLPGSDGRLDLELPEMSSHFRKLMSDVRPDRVCCCAFEQGHLDHDATNFLVAATFDGPVFEFPLYHTYLTRYKRVNRFACDDGEEVLQLSAEEQRLKRSIAQNYPSQPLSKKLLAYELINCARLTPQHLAQTERLRLQTHTDFFFPNLPSVLQKQLMASDKWNRWEMAVSSFGNERRIVSVAYDIPKYAAVELV